MAEVENLMLANHAESLNGLLYVHGGGWSHHWRMQPPSDQPMPPSQFAVAATFLLDPDEIAQQHPFVMIVRSQAGDEVIRAEGAIGPIPPAQGGGDIYRSSVALNASIPFPREGEYSLTAEISGRMGPVVSFWVHDHLPDTAPTDGPSSSSAGYL
jgi:hypothetical protein